MPARPSGLAGCGPLRGSSRVQSSGVETRILNVMLASGRGGVEAMAVRYHEALRAHGYVVTSVGHPSGLLAQSLPGAVCETLDSLCNFDIFAAARLYEIVREFQPRLILCHGNRATNLCLMPFVAGGAQVVQVLHNQSFKPHIRRVDAAICVSPCVRDALAVRYPGVSAFEVANFSRLEIRPVKPAPASPPVIGALGRLHPVKGFDVLLRAAAMLRDRGVDFTLRIAGDGPELQALRDLRGELGLAGRVEFCGWLSEPEAFISGLDLFVVPSRYEAFGLVLAEAMAAGVPVVASDLKGPRAVLEDGRFGRLTQAGDPASLAEAVGAVFAGWPEALSMARAAQPHALNRFSFEAGSDRLGLAVEAILTSGQVTYAPGNDGPFIVPAE